MRKTMGLFLVFLLLFLVNCRRRNEFKDPCIISGRITDAGTRYPVHNAPVKMYEEFSTGSNSPYQNYDFGPVNTDANGNYSLECEPLHKNASYRNMLIFSLSRQLMPTFFQITISPKTTFIRIDTSVTTNARFLLFFQNTTPVSNNDSIYNIYFERLWGNQYFMGNTVLYGQAIYAPFYASYYGYAESVLHYTVNKTGTPQSFTDTLRVTDPFAEVVINDTISW